MNILDSSNAVFWQYLYTDIFNQSPAGRAAGAGEESHQVGGGGVET